MSRRSTLRMVVAAGLAGAAVMVPAVAHAQPREGNATADRPDAPECVADLVGR